MKRIPAAVPVLLCFAFAVMAADISAEQTVCLLTDEESALSEAKSFGYAAALPGDGPSIRVIHPEPSLEQQSPFRLHVRFIPKAGSSVDAATLKVEALKIITVDITDRVKPYVTTGGIVMEKASIPPGNHRIRLTIGDDRGGITQEVFTVKVL